jgi:exoribonuclease R
LPVEDWNAQLSLLVGRAAAALMLDGRVGILRTMPAADPGDVERLRRVANGLGLGWAEGETYGAFLGRLDGRGAPRVAAFLNEAGALFRGAGYTAFDGVAPANPGHAAIAAPYAHCTAPMRRLVDRYVSEACLALCAGRPIPGWVRSELPLLPERMAAGARRAGRVERESIDLVEAAMLEPLVGRTFRGVVVGVGATRATGELALPDLAVMARCDGALALGEPVEAVLAVADPARREVRFRVDGARASGGTAGALPQPTAGTLPRPTAGALPRPTAGALPRPTAGT